MATDLDRLNMAGPANADPVACLNISCSLDTNNDVSMCSSSMMSRDDSCNTATPQSKRQRYLRPLEVPDSTFRDSASSLVHNVSENTSGSSQRIAQQTPKGQRSRDEHDKPPISPNDPCLGMDLRKAALLRSLMLATDPPKQTSSRRQGPASNTRHASRMPQQSTLANCDRISEGNASTDMDTSMNSEPDCMPSFSPSVSPDKIKAENVQLADTATLQDPQPDLLICSGMTRV